MFIVCVCMQVNRMEKSVKDVNDEDLWPLVCSSESHVVRDLGEWPRLESLLAIVTYSISSTFSKIHNSN